MTLIMRPINGLDTLSNSNAAYRTVWRWHFYAGLFCLPFIVVLCITGAIYLFQPQIDAFLDRGFDHLTLSGPPRPLDDQVEAARNAVPDARLFGLEFRADPTDAARVNLMTADGRLLRAVVRPDTLEILEITDWKSRFTQIVRDLHGSLLLSDPGAIAVELAGAWAIVMVITGLYLWWPRGNGIGGVLYPRLGGGRRFLRDLHAVTGFWLSFFALFFLISALPWTKVWGESFRYLRTVGVHNEVKQDWTTGPASEQARRLETYENAPPSPAEASSTDHAEHGASAGAHAGHLGHSDPAGPAAQGERIKGFDRIAAKAALLDLAPPVLIMPPSPAMPHWTVRSISLNFTARKAVEYSPESFGVVKEEGFADGDILQRAIDIGIAAHQGQLFGWFNQLLGLFTAVGYLVLVVTSTLMWWRRRPTGSLGAPPALSQPPRLAPFVIGLIVLLGIFLPTLGVSLVVVLLAETAIRRFAHGVSRWLGLAPVARNAHT
jgi:uncharacterized iron-regulated membrane protein